MHITGRGGFSPVGAVLCAAPDEFGGALLHFAGGFIGEGDGQDISGVDALLDQAGHARGDDARFARAGAGQNQNRPLGGFDRLALRRIQGR